MRADNDHVVGNSVESCKDESTKPHQCIEEKWEDGKNDNNNVCELFYDTRSGDEWDKENDGNALERHSCDNSRDFTAKRDSVEEVDPVFYMDKNVMACDLPEIVVCYKENTYHVVKDICVDEGVPVQEKFLFGEKDSVKSSSNSNQCGSEDLVKANPFETKSLEEENGKTDREAEDFADAEGSSNVKQEDLIVTEEVKDLPTSKASFEIETEENSKDDEVTISSDDLLKEFLTLGDILSREDEQKPLNTDSRGLEEQSQRLLQDKEKTELDETEKTEKTEEKISSVSTTSQEPNRISNDLEKTETDNQQRNYLAEDDKLSSSRFGETSFSAADAVSISGHITYSGPIAFSGSLSVRSDASTTSGRSFAFPILQSEWNSSPVRMAKADKRRQKGWRHSFLCCRFS